MPAGASAASTAAGDGSLVVTNAHGVLTVQVKGVIFGHFDRGKMTVLDYKAENDALPTVSGAKMDLKGAKINVVYSGRDVRFLFPSGTFTLKFDGADIDFSAVGKGTLFASGKGSDDVDGTIAVNGGKPTPVPSVAAFGSTLAVTATVDKGSGNSNANGKP